MPRPAPRASTVSHALVRDRLGVVQVLSFTTSAATPLTAVAGLVTTGFAITGITGIPAAFLVVGALLVLFSVGYVAMARHVVNAGAFYAYISHGLGRPLGVGSAWVALISYNALQVGLYGAVGAAAAPAMQASVGLSLPWWTYALVAWALVAVLGIQQVDVNGRVLSVLLCAEVAVILLYSGADLLHPADGRISLSTLAPANLFAPGVGAILALAVLAFVGFEMSTVFSEESKDPRRTVPVATYLSLVLLGLGYAFAAWAMTVAVGPDRIVEVARAEQTEVIFNLAGAHLGPAFVHIGHALFVTSIVAAMISFHNATARYAYALGRERVLPAAFGRTAPRTGAPKLGSLVQSTIGLAVIVTYATAGWDPLVQLFFWGGTTGGVGVLFLIATTSLAVLGFFTRHPQLENTWRRLLAPGLSTVALGVVVYLVLANLPTLLGVPPGSPLTWAVPAGYLAAAALGAGWALVLRATRPEVYATIGLGARSITAAADRGIGGPRPPESGDFPAQNQAYR